MKRRACGLDSALSLADSVDPWQLRSLSDGSRKVPVLRDDTRMLVPTPRMSRRRWVILALLFLVTVINFIDRQTLSVLAPVIRASFHLSNTQYGRIVSAFQFGMMSGEIPMGAIMDRLGARIGLALAVFWWSTATGAQFLARTGVQFGLMRFWMGTGECGNFSAALRR